MTTLSELIIGLGSGAMAWKLPVRVVATTNHGLSGLAAIDSVTPDAGDRVLLTGQTDTKQNGIWNAASGTWTRATDMDTSAETRLGTTVMVLQGTVYALTIWTMTSPSNGTVRLGSDALTFTRWAMTGASNAPAVIASASGSYVSVQEGTTEVLRLSDAAGVSTISGRGTSTSLAANAGTLDLACAAASSGRCFEGATQVLEWSDAAGVATLSLVGASGGTVAATVGGNLTFNAPSGYKVVLSEAGTAALEVDLQTNVTVLSGRGSAGTQLVANAGNIVIDSASGSVVRLSEGGTTIADFWDNGGQRRMDFAAATVISGSSYIVFQPGGAQHFGVEATSIYMSADSQYFRSTSTATTYGTCLSGVWTLGTSGGTAVHTIHCSTATTVGGAGAGSALPATPEGYWRVSINGTTRKVPYYLDA